MWKHLGAVHPCCHMTKVTDDTLLCQFGSLQNIWHTTNILTPFSTRMGDSEKWCLWIEAVDSDFGINRLHFYGGGRDVLPSSHTADWTTAAENNSVMDQSPAERTWLTTEHMANQHFCSYNALEKNRFWYFLLPLPVDKQERANLCSPFILVRNMT